MLQIKAFLQIIKNDKFVTIEINVNLNILFGTIIFVVFP